MVLKLEDRASVIYFEGHYVSVTLTGRENFGENLPRTFENVEADSPRAWAAHIIRADGQDSILFDCTAYLMEAGKTVDVYHGTRNI